MSMNTGCRKGLRSDINITPYIDILLVLLIIFMVITPVRNKELRVKVPQPPLPTAKVQVNADAIVLTIGEQAQIAINQVPVDFADLGSKLQKLFSARQNKNMFISAGRNLPYGDIVRVVDISKGAGVGDIGLMTVASDCERDAHGALRRHFPDRLGSRPGGAASGLIGHAGLHYPDRFRRVEIADTVTGLAIGFSHFRHPMTQKKFKILGNPNRQEADMSTQKSFDMPAMHIYKI
jgi:biopolymer transport protein TolR